MQNRNIVAFLYLTCLHSGHPGGLCTPCNRLFAPGWDRALRCYWAAALCDVHALSLRAGRAWYSRSKSSTHSQYSPELDVGIHVGKEGVKSIITTTPHWWQAQGWSEEINPEMLGLTVTSSDHSVHRGAFRDTPRVKPWSFVPDCIIIVLLWNSVMELNIQEITLDQWSIDCDL